MVARRLLILTLNSATSGISYALPRALLISFRNFREPWKLDADRTATITNSIATPKYICERMRRFLNTGDLPVAHCVSPKTEQAPEAKPVPEANPPIPTGMGLFPMHFFQSVQNLQRQRPASNVSIGDGGGCHLHSQSRLATTTGAKP
jgi:hypothetical protein